MRTVTEVVVTLERVETVEILRWVEQGWVVPAVREPEPAFSELDVARIALISDLRDELMVEEETIPLVLSLIDEVYGLRRQLTALAEVVRAEPDEVRFRILERLRRRRAAPGER